MAPGFQREEALRLALAHIGLEGLLVFRLRRRRLAVVGEARAFRLQRQLVQLRLGLVERAVDAVHLVAGHHVGGHALLDLREALVIGLAEGLEGLHHVAEGDLGLKRSLHVSLFSLLRCSMSLLNSSSAACSARRFTALTRAPSSIGKVTSEISHRSILLKPPCSARLVAAGELRAETDRKSVESAAVEQREQLAAALDVAIEASGRTRSPRSILADLDPGADGLRRIMLEQHADPVRALAPQRLGKGAGHDHVARGIPPPEEAGIAREHAPPGTDRKRPRQRTVLPAKLHV